ncbi:MAG: pyridoxamine 5'-phosphate oxidase family protein [Pseudomonadales bacterium]|jgi:nitroimidazol reductase NimA-like FMN-containing flavoprotein (pyridoxamine 5'-phosphate oxidase superfamily)|nr:pyridoxamine 5'-phosphate oxidase family protein [Pseudomonadales bacterium]MDP6469805.1 pyridoxamine 5'-phosphate oxidase family protein [Pseudomonadales bacterium]MDP6827593.1 pyridoxamine 5'-phosphate oxidase family protein [Pseudomonadales bacterium]MDP6971275.1 pyridoxamine 5'-phosphate oxidase family protein [Pseudomonadales bacterium]|tara:strand:+ start:606 stop:1034 length:429 start_codon:yes stop_codon:yes gene_type:complete
MADTRMSVEEREAFLADVHVGVLSIARPEGAPLAAPVWYDYQPGGEAWLLTGRQSLKGKLLEVGTPVSLVAQTEDAPYKYVSLEGRVSSITPLSIDADTRPMAIRYLGEQLGTAYAADSAEEGSIRVSITPERWLTVDYAKS